MTKNLNQYLLPVALTAALALPTGATATEPTAAAVLETYANIALAGYEDSLATAKTLKQAVDGLIAKPSEEALGAARKAWLAARVPYQQTEVFRFGNAIVDDWEGRVNAWPLDEGLIDYVAPVYGTSSDENPLYAINIIANASLKIGGAPVDASVITPQLLQSLHEAGEVEANVTTGYHAIEFLLWGQDLNGTGPGAGNRPYTDFSSANCTGGNCDRRADYLRAATDLLISDLQEMIANWMDKGAARTALLTGSPTAGLAAILKGMGSLSYGELAGERIKLGLLLHDPEEEHDCFSDNTHNSHLYDAVGIQNVFLGRYMRVDGRVVHGASLADLVKNAAPELESMLRERLQATVDALLDMGQRAESVEAYDQMIGTDNAPGNAVVQAVIDALLDQTHAIQKTARVLQVGPVEFEGSDSLDAPEKAY